MRYDVTYKLLLNDSSVIGTNHGRGSFLLDWEIIMMTGDTTNQDKREMA